MRQAFILSYEKLSPAPQSALRDLAIELVVREARRRWG
jgi:hypothetical protein